MKISPVKVLVTGFGPYGEVLENPSQTVVETLAKRQWKPRGAVEMHYAVLPVQYEAATRKLIDLINQLKPQALIQLGVWDMAENFRLEQQARNHVYSDAADTAGNKPASAEVQPGGTEELATRLPLKTISKQLAQKKIPFHLGENAGEYICNFTFYKVLDYLRQSGLATLAGFIHIPVFKNGQQNTSQLSRKDMEAGVQEIVRSVVRQLRSGNPPEAPGPRILQG